MVEEVGEFLGRVVPDRFVGIHKTGSREDLHTPAVSGVAGNRQRSPVEGFGVVIELAQVNVVDLAHPLTARAHSPGHRVALFDGLFIADLDRPGPTDRRDVKCKRLGRSHVRLPQPAEHDPQHGVGIRCGSHGGAGVRTHTLLVNDDRGGESLESVDVGTREGRHKSLEEGAVGLVDHPLRIGGNGAEHQRAFSRSGDARKHGEATLRDVDTDVFEVVLARPLHTNHIVAVGQWCGQGVRAGVGRDTHPCLHPWCCAARNIVRGA